MMLCSIWRVAALIALVAKTNFVQATLDFGFKDDLDLTRFVTRPEIRAPRFNVSTYHPDEVTPGYWFIAPYAHIVQDEQSRNYHHTCQTGPAIYDQDGQLVWSGACLVSNQNTCDLRAWQVNGSDFLSAILYKWESIGDATGRGIILDNSFEIVKEVWAPRLSGPFNMHEFNVIDNGQRALYVTGRTVNVELDEHEQDFDQDTGLILDLGITEMDLTTGDILFQWWASDHISISESTATIASLNGPWPYGWNWLHINSIDKNHEGDYMISARYTDAIYKISGQNGSILWTLSGRNPKFSSFELESGFNFSRQHDARFVTADESTEVITLLDNGGDEYLKSSQYSSALVVTLDKTKMVANATKRWIRPNRRRSALRGNFQLLPNGNAFTGWSDNCHISEHSADGKLLMEAEFVSRRFVSYRAYKFNFTGLPSESPTLRATVYGTSPSTSTTVFHVSWNGATEVAQWRFISTSTDGVEEAVLATKARTGYETTLQHTGYVKYAVAEAIERDGAVIGRSDAFATETPEEWRQLEYIVDSSAGTSESDTAAKDEL